MIQSERGFLGCSFDAAQIVNRKVLVLKMHTLADEQQLIELEPKRKRGRYENEGLDRLSDLPDCLLLHVLSFLKTKNAVRTSVLSTRWKHLWKRIPVLRLHPLDFSNWECFVKFVSRILSILDDGSIALHTFVFHSYIHDCEPSFLKRIANYVFSHSVKLRRLAFSLSGDSSLILPRISSCRALTSLKLFVFPEFNRGINGRTLFPKSLNLPALTTLDLTHFAFCPSDNTDCAEPFSPFSSLNSLTITRCTVKDAQILSISSATLVNLSMNRNLSNFTKVNLSAPRLFTFTLSGVPHQKLCGSTLSSVKQVNINAYACSSIGERSLVLLSWLLAFPNIKSLRVTSRTLLSLSCVPDLFKVSFPYNLKSLKVKMEPVNYAEAIMLNNKFPKMKKAFEAGMEPGAHAFISDRIVEFLLQNSPSAKVDIIIERRSLFAVRQWLSC